MGKLDGCVDLYLKEIQQGGRNTTGSYLKKAKGIKLYTEGESGGKTMSCVKEAGKFRDFKLQTLLVEAVTSSFFPSLNSCTVFSLSSSCFVTALISVKASAGADVKVKAEKGDGFF